MSRNQLTCAMSFAALACAALNVLGQESGHGWGHRFKFVGGTNLPPELPAEIKEFHAQIVALHDRFDREIESQLTAEQAAKLPEIEVPMRAMRAAGPPPCLFPGRRGDGGSGPFNMPMPPPVPLMDAIFFQPKLKAWNDALSLTDGQSRQIQAILKRQRQEALDWLDTHEPPAFNR